MPIRPFPFPFTVGVDLCQVSRIRKIMNSKNENFLRFLRRLLTAREIKYCNALFPEMHGSAGPEKDMLMEYLTGRWAAKEAAMKAVKPRRVLWQEVEIWQSETTRAPFAVILNEAAAKEASAPEADADDVPDDSESSQEVQTGDDETRDAILKAIRTDDGAPSDSSDVKSSSEKKKVKILGINTFDSQKTRHKNAVTVLRKILNDSEGQIAQVSLSHDGDYACAVVLAIEEPAANDVGGEAAARELS